MRNPAQFPAFSRLLHWLMAVMVLAMLFIGVGMAASVSERYHLLVSIHEPLGIAILVLVVIRFINRLLNPPPPLPAHLALWQRLAATMSHYLLYALMFVLPLVGWAMLSAARYPIVLYGPLHLPPILSHDAMLYADLAPAPHLSGASAFRDLPRPSRRRAVPWPHLSRRRLHQHDALAGAGRPSRAVGGQCAGLG